MNNELLFKWKIKCLALFGSAAPSHKGEGGWRLLNKETMLKCKKQMSNKK